MNKNFCFFVLFFPFSCIADTYVIYKSIPESVIYMLPVVHVQVTGLNVENLKSAIKKTINEDIKICVEVGKKVKNEDEFKVEKIIKSRQMSISKYMEFEDFLILAEYLNIKSEMRQVVYSNYTPYFLYELIKKKYMEAQFFGYYSVDDELINLRPDLSPIELQSSAEIADIVYDSLLNVKEWRDVLMNQIKFINCKDCINKYIYLFGKTTEHIFKNHNIEISRNYSKKMAELSGSLFIHELFVSRERNEILADRMTKFSKDNRCNFVVVGSAHFGGDYGLDKIMPNIEKITIEY